LNRPFFGRFFYLLYLYFMKYRQLTKDQLKALHEEFSQFLASHQIDAHEWKQLKKEKPSMVDELLCIFSDIVWEDVLSKTTYIEHISEKYINLFQCNSQEMIRLCVSLKDPDRSFLKAADMTWFLQHPLDTAIDYARASKKHQKERNMEVFQLIEIGGQIGDGTLFKQVSSLIS